MIAPCRTVDPAKQTWTPPGYRAAPPQIDDSITQCADCRTDIWIAPGKLSLVRTGHNAKTVCWPCLKPYWEEAEADGVYVEIEVSTGRRSQPRIG